MTPASDWFENLPKHRLMAEYSLWSADLLRIGPDMDRVDRHVDLYHVDVATEGQSDVSLPDHAAQREGGTKGGRARAASMTAAEREEMARLAAQARWKKD